LYEFVNQIKFHKNTIDYKRIVDKVLFNLIEQFDPIMAFIKEIKDLSIMVVKCLMMLLRSYEQKLLCRVEKSV